VTGLFVMAFAGASAGVPTEETAIRSLTGAIVLYVVARICGLLLARLLADVLVPQEPDDAQPEEALSERPSE
jgi:hypothetical protein